MLKVIQQSDESEFFEMFNKENRWTEKSLKESDISDAIKTVRAFRKKNSEIFP